MKSKPTSAATSISPLHLITLKRNTEPLNNFCREAGVEPPDLAQWTGLAADTRNPFAQGS